MASSRDINPCLPLWAWSASGAEELWTTGFPGANPMGLNIRALYLQLYYSLAESLQSWKMQVEGHTPVLGTLSLSGILSSLH